MPDKKKRTTAATFQLPVFSASQRFSGEMLLSRQS
jgi:hypothetical protein